MASTGRHTGSCERAKNHEYHCQGCAGARHGWPGRLEFVRDTTGERRAEFRALVEKRWADAQPRTKPPGRSVRRMGIAFDTAVADLLDWLARNADVTDRIDRVGNALGEEALPAIEANSDPAGSQTFRRASEAHFWCGVLAAFACALAELQELSDRVREQATTVLLGSERSPLDDEFAAEAVQRTWDAVAPLLAAPRLGDALWTVRGLAILICPEPERHPAVSRCCLDPIAGEATPEVKAVIAEDTRRRLAATLPPDWLPRARAALGG